MGIIRLHGPLGWSPWKERTQALGFGSQPYIASTKFTGYGIYSPPTTGLNATKFVGYGIYSSPSASVNVTKVVGYAILTPRSSIPLTQDGWQRPKTSKATAIAIAEGRPAYPTPTPVHVAFHKIFTENTSNKRNRFAFTDQPYAPKYFVNPPTGFGFSFAELNDLTFTDWKTSDAIAQLIANYDIPSDLENKLSPFQQPGMPPSFLIPDIQPDYSHFTWTPWIYVFMQEDAESTANSEGSKWRVRWNWANSDNSIRVTPLTEMYNFQSGRFVSTARRKMRGKGRSIQVEINSESGKNFRVLGWAIWTNKNTAP